MGDPCWLRSGANWPMPMAGGLGHFGFGCWRLIETQEVLVCGWRWRCHLYACVAVSVSWVTFASCLFLAFARCFFAAWSVLLLFWMREKGDIHRKTHFVCGHGCFYKICNFPVSKHVPFTSDTSAPQLPPESCFHAWVPSRVFTTPWIWIVTVVTRKWRQH